MNKDEVVTSQKSRARDTPIFDVSKYIQKTFL